MWPTAATSSRFCSFNDVNPEDMESVPVLHGFGRGEYKIRAEAVKIPRVLLDKLEMEFSGSSTESFARCKPTWLNKRGVSVRSEVGEMTCAVTRPRGRGRSRVLHQRAVRPGGMQDKVS